MSFTSAVAVLAVTSAVAVLAVALAFGVRAVGNPSTTFVIAFALAFAFAAIDCNVAKATAIVALGSLAFAFTFVNGVYVFSIFRCLVILPLVPLLFGPPVPVIVDVTLDFSHVRTGLRFLVNSAYSSDFHRSVTLGVGVQPLLTRPVLPLDVELLVVFLC